MLGCISVPSADMHISLDFAANCWPFPRNCALSDLPQTPLELIERLKADMERGDPKKAVCAVWRQVSPGNYTIVNYIAAEKSLHRVRTDASEMLDEMPAEDLLVILERMAQSEQSSDVSRLLPAPQARFELRPSAATAARTARAARPAAPAPAEREEVEKEEVKETQKAAQNAPQASAAAKAAPQPAKTTTTVATTATVAHKHHAANGYAIPDRFIHPERAAAQARAQRRAQEEKLRAEQAMKQETPAATATPAVASAPTVASAPAPWATPEKRPSNTVQGDLFALEAGCVLKQSPEANRADSAPAAASGEASPASSDLFELTAAAEQTLTTPKAKGRTSKSAGAKTTRTKKSASATATKKPRTRKKASEDAASGDAPTSAEEKTASRPKRSRRRKEPLSPIEAQKSAAEFALESEVWPQA